MITGKLPVLAVFAALLVAIPARAGDDFQGANIEALGRAAVANPTDNSTISLNPGAMALAERYDVSGWFDLGPTGDLEWGISALDSRTAPIAFGVSWRRTVAEPPITLAEMPGWVQPGVAVPNVKRTHEVTIAIAGPIDDRKFSVGVNGTVIIRHDDRGGNAVNGNADVGAAWQIDKEWAVGLAGRNLIPLKGQVGLDTGITAGVHYERKDIAAWAFDLDWQTSGQPVFPLSFRLGGEALVSAFRPRLGYRFDGATGTHWLVPGIGGENDSGAIDYALAIPLSGATRWKDLVHTFSVRVKF
jgi:hypothetical protein